MASTRRAAALALAVLSYSAAGCHRADSNARQSDNVVTEKQVQEPVKQFSDRVAQYLRLRTAAELTVPNLADTSDPAKISAREQALGQAIRRARAEAGPGDLFTPDAAVEFGRLIAEDFAKRPPAVRAAVVEEVPMKVPPAINEPYPTTLPLATVPPTLLMKLPTLPPELEYRFLGHHLILRDIKANLIVDYIPDVVPA